MPFVRAETAPQFTWPGLSVTGLAAPSRGSRETSVWRLSLTPEAPGALHSVDREEIFVALSGRAEVTLGGELHELGAGDTLIVPAGQAFSIRAAGAEPFEAVALAPVGARAKLAEGEPFAPPWTE
ncbi:MAG TPA: cupin domain-containing protein [Polyangiaceae bacterium]|jgi:mannose-6-phosphate isomerase-like protein (cupin superfamily)|nr:cupin domain-containing protein [Polyangiaceae bacterium]